MEAIPQRRLRVLTLVDSVGTGGGERLAAEITQRLDPSRFERTYCVSRWPPARASDPQHAAAADEVRRSGVRFMGLERNSSAALWAWRPLLSLLRGGAVDVLHAHKFGSNLWAAVLGSVARPPVLVAHEHSWSYQGQLRRRLVDRYLIAPRVDAFVAVSREDRRRMIEIEGISPEKIRFIPNGVATSAARQAKDVRHELGIDAGDPLIGAVGALQPLKAYDVLVRAAALLAPKLPRLRVLIVGRGEERPRLEALIDELGLRETVYLLGFRRDVPDVIRALDVAVSSSDSEGSPLSIMEYMEGGKPVVATRVGGVPDMIEDGVHGRLVEPQDPEGLAAAIEQLIRHPDRAAAMGARGRERRRKEFDIEVTVRRIEALYDELWAASAARRR